MKPNGGKFLEKLQVVSVNLLLELKMKKRQSKIYFTHKEKENEDNNGIPKEGCSSLA